mmetsp:Transcript_1285/g.1334  ORF Transcript_1285/g.1334 Transcript_1285/m.1334 type:complete len:174 (-) Transcript_1285:150-671(-)
MIFAMLVLGSGLLCFSLEKNWFKTISASAKVPSYALLGTSISFAFIYSVMDLIQWLFQFFQRHYAFFFMTEDELKKTPLNPQILVTNIQIYLLLSISLIIGVLFGTIFGIIDIEDYSRNSVVLYKAIIKDITLCEPIGIIFGAFTGFMIEFLRQEELVSRPEVLEFKMKELSK